jgi:hypothetical protein
MHAVTFVWVFHESVNSYAVMLLIGSLEYNSLK